MDKKKGLNNIVYDLMKRRFNLFLENIAKINIELFLFNLCFKKINFYLI